MKNSTFLQPNEALALSQKEALTLLHKKVEKKRKMTLLDTFVVDECSVAKLSIAGASIEPSPTKSLRRTKSRSSKTEGI